VRLWRTCEPQAHSTPVPPTTTIEKTLSQEGFFFFSLIEQAPAVRLHLTGTGAYIKK
jgi:hypothetical protein